MDKRIVARQDYQGLVIETLATSEAEWTSVANAYREISIVAVAELARITKALDRATLTISALREELRRRRNPVTRIA